MNNKLLKQVGAADVSDFFESDKDIDIDAGDVASEFDAASPSVGEHPLTKRPGPARRKGGDTKGRKYAVVYISQEASLALRFIQLERLRRGGKKSSMGDIVEEYIFAAESRLQRREP